MALEVRVSGAATLHRVAAQMRAESRKDLARSMSVALSKATDVVRREVRASAEQTMPREGGYNATFLKSLNFRMGRQNSGNTATVTLTTFADGSSERRDIKALEAGRLRHPVYGRSRPGARKGERHANPWAVTSIRAGFWKRGTDAAADEAVKQLESVIEDYAQRLVGE